MVNASRLMKCAAAFLIVPMCLTDASGQMLPIPTSDVRTTIDYYRPRVAAAADGSYAVAWEALEQLEFVTEWKIAVQRYSPTGQPVGPTHYFDPEIGCFGSTDVWLSDGQQNVELAFNDAGDLLVLMEHYGEYDIIVTTTWSSEITLGAVNSSGQIIDLGASESCLQYKFVFPGADEQDRPRMALANGGLAVVMDGFFGGSNFRNVGLQFFDGALAKVGDVSIPHDDQLSEQGFHAYPDIATNGSRLVVVWHECPYIDNQGNAAECDIMAQFAELTPTSLTPIGGNIRVNAGDPTGTVNFKPSVSMNAAGKTVIVWQDSRNSANGDIYGQVYDGSGQAVGSNFRVSDAGGGELESTNGLRPEVAVGDNGFFVVAWGDSTTQRRSLYRYYQQANIGGSQQVLTGGSPEFAMPDVAVSGNNFYLTALSRDAGGNLGVAFQPLPSFVGAEEPERPESFALGAYPNPFQASLKVLVRTDTPGVLELDVVDLLGRTVASENRGVVHAGEHKFTIDSEPWTAGLYLVRVRSAGAILTQSVVRSQ